MRKKTYVELLAIYIVILALSYGWYVLFVAFNADTQQATNLLIWSATLFGTIALLYTFNQWRLQKEAEVYAEQARKLFDYIFELDSMFIEYNSTWDSDINVKFDVSAEAINRLNQLIYLILPRLTFISKKLPINSLIEILQEIIKRTVTGQTKFRNANLTFNYQVDDVYVKAKKEIQKLYEPLRKLASFKDINN